MYTIILLISCFAPFFSLPTPPHLFPHIHKHTHTQTYSRRQINRETNQCWRRRSMLMGQWSPCLWVLILVVLVGFYSCGSCGG